MAVKKLACVSCVAPLATDEDVTQVICPYCSASMIVDRGEGYAVLKGAQQVSQAVRDVGGQT